MYLQRLEIHGFKSFAKKTAFAFEPGITSIVGPNGSGKSNIADSLRWVFGEQSLKLLRGKKSEDVIFAGSDQKARLGTAQVEVTFDNSDKIMPIDYAEVVIARRVYRDGNSEYLINNHQVRLLDVQELLSKSGFGNTSYHVIGQGMIDQLILGGPQAVKQLIEEAAGIKPYYLKRDRTLRRLEVTSSNLNQVKALIAEIEPRLRSLRRQTRKLEQRTEIEQELGEAQILHYGNLKRGLVQQIEEVNRKILVFDRQIKQLEEGIAQFGGEIEKEERQYRNDKFASLQRQLEDLRQTKQKLLEEQAVLRGKIKATSMKPTEAHINWQEIKTKFRRALEDLQNFFKRTDLDPNRFQQEAQAIESMFVSLLNEIETDTSDQPAAEIDTDKQNLAELDVKVSELVQKIASAEKALSLSTEQEELRKNQLFVKERLWRNKQDTLTKIREQKNWLLIEQAKLQTRKEALDSEAKQALGENFEKLLDEKRGISVPQELPDKIAKLKKQLEVIGGVDELTLQEYRETEDRYQYLSTQSQDLEKAAHDLKTVIDQLDEEIKKQFNEAFNKISEKFAEYFRILFGGGKATMTILREERTGGEDLSAEALAKEEEGVSEDETGEPKKALRSGITGIEIRATPPGKKLAGIAALSGGERALTSIALLCAILASYPSPFVVLDEVDAALDEANSVRFGSILGTLAHKTQFITITHNRETMRQSHTLYGVTMGDDGISRVLSLKLEQAAAYSSKN